MKIIFEVGTHLLIGNNLYQIVGIDSYLLQNHLREIREWKSYTLVGNSERIGVSIMNEVFTLWRNAPNIIESGKMNFEFSGIANITFEGDNGPSTPVAELTWFDLKNDDADIFLIERFLSFNSENKAHTNTFYQIGKMIKSIDIQLIEANYQN